MYFVAPLIRPFALLTLGLGSSFVPVARQGKVDETTLEYYHQGFVIRTGKTQQFVPLSTPGTASPERHVVAFRRNENYAVWDARGLTIRHGRTSRSMRLEDFPVSDRFFSHDELARTVQLISEHKRKRAASSLAGAVRVGTDVYFLVRWSGSDGTPWTEALVKVGLDGAGTWPEVLGRFSGLSIAFRPVDDRLAVLDGGLGIVARDGSRWGLSRYDLASHTFSFRQMGASLRTYLPTSHRTGAFVERTSYGTVLAGRVDLVSGFRRLVFESRGAARFLDSLRPAVVVARTSDSLRLVNADTGSELRLLPDYGVARSGGYVVVWTPAEKPESARLYSADRWREISAVRVP